MFYTKSISLGFLKKKKKTNKRNDFERKSRPGPAVNTQTRAGE